MEAGMLVALFFGFAICLAFGIWIVLPYLYRRQQVGKLRHLCQKTRSLVLTYDDGPSGEFTPKLLNLLAEYEASGTFFVLGSRVDSNAAVLSEIAARGHEIGSHSYHHLNAWTSLPWRVAKDIDAGIDCLDRQNVAVRLFRPPNGKITLATFLKTLFNGRRMAWWTIDSTDTCPETISTDELERQVKAAGGGVILLHDFERQDNSGRNEFVLEATRRLLEMARREKFKVTTFGQLLDDGTAARSA